MPPTSPENDTLLAQLLASAKIEEAIRSTAIKTEDFDKIAAAISNIKIDVPNVNVNMPDSMNVSGEVSLKDVSAKHPLPVVLYDIGGNPIQQYMPTGGGGGGAKNILSGDIEIGAVELKNGTDDTRASITSANALKVDGSAVTQPISASATLEVRQVSGATDSVSVIGTVAITSGATLEVIQVSGASSSVSASQSGVWTVQPGNTANTTQWLVGESHSFLNVTGATTSTVVKSGAGVLHTLTINKRGTGSVADVYADLVGEGSQIASVDTTLSTTAFLYDIAFTSGLTLVTTGAAGANLTVAYR